MFCTQNLRARLYETSWLDTGSFKGKSIFKYKSAIMEVCPTIKFRLYEAGWKRVGSLAKLDRFHEICQQPTWGELARLYNGLSQDENGLVHAKNGIVALTLQTYLNGTNFRVDLFSWGQKNRFSREFIFANLVFPKLSRGLIFANSAFLNFSPGFIFAKQI